MKFFRLRAGEKEKGSLLLDLALLILILIIFMVVMAYFGLTLNTIITYIQKFLGLGVVDVK